MTFPIVDYTTDVGKTRLLIPDVAPVTQGRQPDAAPVLIFTDEQINAFLLINGGNVKRAAADALDTIATDEALISKVIKTEDLQTDGAKLLEALRKRAIELRKGADADDVKDVGFFTVPGQSQPDHVTFHVFLQE